MGTIEMEIQSCQSPETWQFDNLQEKQLTPFGMEL